MQFSLAVFRDLPWPLTISWKSEFSTMWPREAFQFLFPFYLPTQAGGPRLLACVPGWCPTTHFPIHSLSICSSGQTLLIWPFQKPLSLMLTSLSLILTPLFWPLLLKKHKTQWDSTSTLDLFILCIVRLCLYIINYYLQGFHCSRSTINF